VDEWYEEYQEEGGGEGEIEKGKEERKPLMPFPVRAQLRNAIRADA
jgi:hypothetical protein